MGKGPLENTVENYLVDQVKALGGVALKGAVPGRRFLDRIVVLPGGRTIYVECKRPIGGRYSVHQGETLERLQALGHEIARVRTRAEVDAMLAPAPQTHAAGEIAALQDCSEQKYGQAFSISACHDLLNVLKAATPAPQNDLQGWTKVPDEPPLELLKSINRDNQALVYENGRYYNAWFEFEQAEGGWLWTDDADSEPNPSHYRLLNEVALDDAEAGR